ncbi:MAG: 3-deoxy-manno-octulosonate cytidylyltransferase [Bacteroidota bacterium]
MVRRVYEQALQAHALGTVIVATDDDRIAEHVRSFGGNVLLTDGNHASGTDRCAEVAAKYPEYRAVVNIQGDEPFLDPEQIDRVAHPLLTGEAGISTLAKQITAKEELENPNVVKVVFGTRRQALYFSRYPIPFLRGQSLETGIEKGFFYKHIGLYGYTQPVLKEISRLSVSTLESLESLEQLRWLENGYTIQVEFTDLETQGIDTPEDLERVLKG